MGSLGWNSSMRVMHMSFGLPSTSALHHDVDRRERGLGVGIVDAHVCTATLATLERGTRHRLAHRQQVTQIDGDMPSRIVLPMAFDAGARRARAETLQLAERRAEIA